MFTAFATALTTDLTTSIPAALVALVSLIGGVTAIGWGKHFLRSFGILRRA